MDYRGEVREVHHHSFTCTTEAAQLVCKIYYIYVLDAVDPFVLLFRCGGRDPVHHVVPLHYPSISFCLARLDQLTAVVGDV